MKKCIIILVFVVFGACFYFQPGAEPVDELQEDLKRYQQNSQRIQERIRDVEGQIQRLRNNDPAAIEAVARDKFGFCREGEEIYQIEVREVSK